MSLRAGQPERRAGSQHWSLGCSNGKQVPEAGAGTQAEGEGEGTAVQDGRVLGKGGPVSPAGDTESHVESAPRSALEDRDQALT